MMDASSIEKIQESAAVLDANAVLNDKKTVSPHIIVPKSMQIESLESMMPHASHYKLHYRTTSIKDYISYCKASAEANTTCFIDDGECESETVFDLGSNEVPGHKYHKARLSLNKTAAFKALLNINGYTLNQREASDFLENWIDEITAYNSSEQTMHNSIAAKSLREISIEALAEQSSNVGDFSESASAFEKIEAKNQDQIVAAFKFTCTPYLDFQDRNFYFKVRILTSSDKPKIVFNLMQLEKHQEEISNEFKEIIEDGLFETDIKCYIGTI